MSLPAPLARALARLPGYPGSVLFAGALNLAIRAQLPEDARAALEGKVVRICVTDAALRFDVCWCKNGFVASKAQAEPDLTIGASLHDFMLLARRLEDPDTLFFGRRLSMEGDTELGLLLKNTLDAIDIAVFDPARLLPAHLRAAFQTTSKESTR